MSNRSVRRFLLGPSLSGLLVVLVLAQPGRLPGEPLALPPKLQEKVNQGIENGVEFLKKSQALDGTWALDDEQRKWKVGYAALPGLTLLECGVSPDDPVIRKAADFVRVFAPQTDKTYEIALSILFLDRLGQSKDRRLIQHQAGRLLAAQTHTGGWGYNCPKMSIVDTGTLVAVLQRMNPEEVGRYKNKPESLQDRIAGRPQPDFKNVTAKKETLEPKLGGRAEPRLPNVTTRAEFDDSTTDKLTGSFQMEPSEYPHSYREQTASNTGNIAKPGTNEETKPGGNANNPGNGAGQDPKNGNPMNPKDPPRPRPTLPLAIPASMRLLPILSDPSKASLVEPDNKGSTPTFGSTDNSNTQFAMLAVWAARKHDVPVKRSLTLIERRFHTSQLKDGRWNYRYRFGGDPDTPGSSAMTCVGLLGLAMSAGLVVEDFKRDNVLPPDWRVVKSFDALQRFVGDPRNVWENIPQGNLYAMWSIERVGVLYGLRTIGKKDWYRWGCEVLVANQQDQGNWANGGYHGASAPIDTSFALLFLKKANLTGDLSSLLTFNTNELDKSPEKPAKVEEKPVVATIPTPPEEEKTPEPETPKIDPTKLEGSNPTVAVTPKKPAAVEETDDGSSSRGRIWGWILGGLAVVLLGSSVALLVLYQRSKTQEEADDEDQPRPAPRKKKGVKHS